MDSQNIIDKSYQVEDKGSSIDIIEKAMEIARAEIPNGHVATYIPELGKVDPNQWKDPELPFNWDCADNQDKY